MSFARFGDSLSPVASTLTGVEADSPAPSASQQRESSGAGVLEKPDLSTPDNSERDKFAHYVSTARLSLARATGQPVVALCGKVWVPTQINSGHPVCPRCKEIMESIQNNPGDVWPF